MRDSLEFDLSARNGGFNSKLCFGSSVTVLSSLSDMDLKEHASPQQAIRGYCKSRQAPRTGNSLRPNRTRAELLNSTMTRGASDPVGDYAARVWLGRDYMNRFTDKIRVSSSITANMAEDVDQQRTHPRLPWHDVGAMVAGSAAADLARHFIQRWNFSKNSAELNATCRFLIPKSIRNLKFNNNLLCDKGVHNCSVQVLRSLGSWSGNSATSPEDSIQQALVQLIDKSKHYIYIETEVFISAGGDNTQVTNRINDSLVRRILRAYTSKQSFRVIVILPLLPAFEGRLGAGSGSVVQTVMHWQYESICRGQNSLITRLSRNMPIQLISEYLCFFGLRTFDYRGDIAVSEIVYNHSKTVIVDDQHVIIGSANITDRSLVGNRNSEIACLISDEVFVDSVMNGIPYKAGRFAGSLRLRLMMEHLGYMDTSTAKNRELFRDPVSDAFWKDLWLPTARRNTSIFEQVFNCTPSDEVRDFMEFAFWQERPKLADLNPETAKRALDDVQGHLCIFPLGFLRNELLRPAIISKEGLMPASLWM